MKIIKFTKEELNDMAKYDAFVDATNDKWEDIELSKFIDWCRTCQQKYNIPKHFKTIGQYNSNY